MRNTLVLKKYAENDVPVPAIEKIEYLKLGDTILELIHIPNGSTMPRVSFLP
jgi:lactoylglutathione lyase